MTQLIHRIKHADQFHYIIFVCHLQYLLTSSLVRHNIFEFVKQLNDDQRSLEKHESQYHTPDESDQRAMLHPFLLQI
jgi:hypothetical protein